MTKKTLIAMAVLGVMFGALPALSHADMAANQNQYNYDQEALKHTQDKINEVNKQIQAIEQPVLTKYQGLDQKLESIDKPYRDQINKFNQEMQQVDQPYRKQIIERNEEMKRVKRETDPAREELRHLTEVGKSERKTLETDAILLQADRAAQHQMQMQQKAKQAPQRPMPTAAKLPPKIVPKNVGTVIKNPAQQPTQ
jgi:gas vesicle protein